MASKVTIVNWLITRNRTMFIAVGIISIFVLAWLLTIWLGPIPFPRIPIGDWIEAAVLWLTVNWAPFFDGISFVVEKMLGWTNDFLLWLPWPVVVLLFALIGWKAAGRRTAIFGAAGLLFLGTLNLWQDGMSTLALVVTAVTISLALGIPLGILAASNNRSEVVIKPILDAMQTMPSFVYLIPAILFFGIGRVPGVLATVIFSLPPVVRLTNLGIREVSSEVMEAASSFGSTWHQLLTNVQLPLAMPTIMAGVNQTIMMALSMVVVASMIGAPGLGYNILYGIMRVELGIGVESGIGILLLAMILDRITQGLGKTRKRTLTMG